MSDRIYSLIFKISNCPTSFYYSSLCIHMSDRFVPLTFGIAKRPTGYIRSIFKTLICPTGSCLQFSEYQNVRQVISLNFKNLQMSDRFMSSTSRISKRLTAYPSLFLKHLGVRQVHTFNFQNS